MTSEQVQCMSADLETTFSQKYDRFCNHMTKKYEDSMAEMKQNYEELKKEFDTLKKKVETAEQQVNIADGNYRVEVQCEEVILAQFHSSQRGFRSRVITNSTYRLSRGDPTSRSDRIDHERSEWHVYNMCCFIVVIILLAVLGIICCS